MYTKPLRPDEIYHQAGQRKDHKYIARIDLGDKFRYFYSQAEIKAYELAKAGKKAVQDTANKAADTANKAINTAKTNIDKTVDSAKKVVDETAESVSKNVNNVAENAKKSIDKTSKAVSDKVKDARSAVNRTAKSASDRVSGTAKAVGKKVDDTGKKAGSAINSVKKAFGDDNQYVVNKKNYNQKKKEIQNTKEWQDIVKSRDKEYRRTDSKGKEYYDYDQYLVDKKHPVLDALSDFGTGRKISIRKQSAETLVAGVKDYIKMAEDTVQMVAGLSIGLLTAKIKNQQGSYEDEKKQLKKQINNAKNLLSSENPQVSLAIDQISKEVKNRTSSDLANDLIDVASTVAKDSVDANGRVKKPSQSTINDALDQVSEIAKSKAKTQAERDKIDLAAQKAKEYQNMSKEEIKEDVKNTAIDAATKAAGENVVDEVKSLKTQAEINKASRELEERKRVLEENPDFVESKREVINGEETYRFMTREESLADIKEKEEAINKAKESVKDSPAAKVSDYINNNPKASAGISAYAREKGLSYEEARAELLELPLSTIKKYAEKSR